ncbi:tyrosine-type recombinase/integrase [Algihabitans albus]|uniref:tyrosine-type recombinase/integrase n=1 Tax=Algihabitans albus TaxID=2164067 RepID=UPI000E5D4E7F|nr:site-specific integrase [Algihabitans albus]
MNYGVSEIYRSKSWPRPNIFVRQRLYDLDGGRKYITATERDAALAVARSRRPEIYTLYATLAYSGCRLSEALELDVSRIDFQQSGLIFRTLKNRSGCVFRLVPVPDRLLADLDRVHAIRSRQDDLRRAKQPLWNWSRTHAWRLIKSILSEAGVQGAAATPKGLRHGFGVTAVTKGVPLNLVQRWLGHTQLATTAIYADALGDEERHINTRMWS